MAISTPKIAGDGSYPIEVVAPWAVNYTGDLVGGSLSVELIAAPSREGSATYLTQVIMGITRNPIFINHTPDASIALTDGVGEHVFGPIQFQEHGQTLISKDFIEPLKVTDGKALDITCVGSVAGYQASVFIYVEGFTGDKPLG